MQMPLNVPKDKTTTLKMRVSHHPHGDWQLRVLVNGKVIKDQIIGSESVGSKEWLDVDVDLSPYGGEVIRLDIENRANNWNCEWAYWNSVRITTK